MRMFKVVLFCMVMEEYNPPYCQDEVQDNENDESNSPQTVRKKHNFILKGI